MYRKPYRLGEPSMRLSSHQRPDAEKDRVGVMVPGACMRRRRVGTDADTETKLWWTLRATNFTRTKVEHIIATVLYFRGVLTKSAFKQYRRDQVPRPTASHWHRIRRFLAKFGTTPDAPGRLRVVAIDAAPPGPAGPCWPHGPAEGASTRCSSRPRRTASGNAG